MAEDYEALARTYGGQAAGPEAAEPTKTPDFAALAAQYGGQIAAPAAQPETTARGIAGAVTRGLALPAAGALAGAAIGAPIGGVGAIPGAIAGAGAATLAQVVGDPIVSSINSMLGTKYKLPTDAMEDFLTRVGVAEPRTAAERIVQTAASGAGAAGGITSAGRAVQTAAGTAAPVTREVGRMLAAQPVAQVAGGAGAGAAGQSVGEAGGGPVAQIGASLLGGVAGGRAGARTTAPTTAPKSQPVIAEAGRRGVPVLTSDVIQPQTFIGKSAQRIGERVPIAGTGPVRAKQQKARVEAVRGVLREFGADDAANLSDDIMSDLATKRASDLTKYSSAKTEVIDRLAGKGVVPVPRAVQAIDDQIADLTRRRTEGADEAIGRLGQIKNDLQNRDLFQLEAYRKDELSKIFKDDPARPMSIAARDAGEKALRAVYAPVREDMGDFIKSTGERRDFDRWMVSNKRLSELAGEMDMGALKSVLKSGRATPEDVNKLLFSKKPSEIRQLYSGLSPAGRANARTSIMAQAAQKAEYQIEDGTKMFSPEKFNAEIKRLKPQVGVFFKGDDLEQVEGLSRVLTLTRRAGEAGVTTPTGQEAVPFVVGGVLHSLLGSIGGTVAAAGGVGLAARVYESAPVRNLMINISRTKLGSTEEAALAKRLISTMEVQSEAIKAKPQENK